MATERTFKTGDVIGSLSLVEIRRQQRRVTTLLHGNSKDVPLLSYRQAESTPYRDGKFGTRQWPAGGAIHQRTSQTDRRESDLFWDPLDDPSKRTEQFKPTQNYSSRPLNNSPRGELASFTPLPPIDSHKNNCERSHSSGDAKKKLEKRRQMPPASEKGILGIGHVTKTRKPSRKLSKNLPKPVVKYQHQKVEPSAEERYRKYRQVTVDGTKKFPTGSTPETGLRSDSSLSSVSDISALRKRQVMFQDGDYENDHQSASILKSSARRGTIDSSQLPMETALGIESLRAGENGGIPGFGSLGKGHPNEEDFKAGLASDPGRCHSSPIQGGSAWKNEASIRLPDIEIYNSNIPVVLPEPRKWNPGIGETSRAFVYSYFDHLPSVNRSRADDDSGSNKENQLSSLDGVNMKISIRRK